MKAFQDLGYFEHSVELDDQEETNDTTTCAILQEKTVSASTIRQRTGPSIDDLLLGGSPITSTPVLESSNIVNIHILTLSH